MKDDLQAKPSNGHQPDTAQTPALTTRDKELAYTPFGDEIPVRLTINIVKNQLCTPSKNGIRPSDVDCMLFMKVCEARRLNPWLKDAFLIGYDQGPGKAKFEVITAHQALMKRAELHSQYDGIESGVIVQRDGKVVDVIGDFILPGDTLVGGWAIVHRKDRSRPAVERVNFSTFNTGLSRWAKDPCGMISKCAEAGAYRKAFPSDIGGLYIEQEMERTALQIERAALSYTPDVRPVDTDALSVEHPEGPPPEESKADQLSQRIKDIETGDAIEDMKFVIEEARERELITSDEESELVAALNAKSTELNATVEA